MKYWIEHDQAGKILASYSGNDDQPPLRGGVILEVNAIHFPDDFYVQGGEVLPRPACPATVTELTFESVPLPCSFTVGSDVHSLTAEDDSTVVLEFDYPATYKIKIESWPYLDGIFEVTQP